MANNDANSDNPNPAVNNGNAAETLPGEPAAKKLRSSDPDLTVILKYSVESEEEENDKDATNGKKKTDASKDGEILEKKYLMYGNHLAKHSNFVDTALSLPMVEQKTRSVTFTDVNPATFELALSLLENPLVARDMKAEQAVQVVAFYDKYEFAQGFKLCDQVIHEYIEKEGHYLPRSKYYGENHPRCFDSKLPPDNLDFLVNSIILADELNLPKAKESGIEYLKTRLDNFWSDLVPYGRTMFTVEHIKKLHPMFMRGLFDCCGLEQDEIKSSLFPKFFVQNWSHEKLENAVRIVEISNSGHPDIDGFYAHCDTDHYTAADKDGKEETRELVGDGQRLRFVIRKCWLADDDWAIIGEYWDVGDNYLGDGRVFWKCPYTENLQNPPEQGWIPVDPVSRGMEKAVTVKPIKVSVGPYYE